MPVANATSASLWAPVAGVPTLEPDGVGLVLVVEPMSWLGMAELVGDEVVSFDPPQAVSPRANANTAAGRVERRKTEFM